VTAADMSNRITDIAQRIDEQTYAISLEIPAAKVVLLQGFIELYEGIGTIHTLDPHRSLVCILTTPAMLADCIDVLHAIQYTVPWRLPRPDETQIPGFLGNLTEKGQPWRT